MSNLTIPYDELSLRMGLIEQFGLTGDNQDEGEVEKMINEINSKLNADLKLKVLNGTKAELNKSVAEENGIEVIDLINSQNYKELIDEYRCDAVRGFVKVCEEGGMTNRCAWAMVAIGLGLIES